MDLKDIINVSGKPGLFKIISQSNNNVIIESLIDKKRSVLYSHNQATLLEEIGIYTYNDTIPISELFIKIAKKNSCGPAINHKSKNEDLINYFRDILNEYDEDRVYISDIKKVIQWYNIMQSVNLIKISKKKTKKETKKETE